MESVVERYAGVLGHHAVTISPLNSADFAEVPGVATASSDDRLHKPTHGRLVPESLIHGSFGQQRALVVTDRMPGPYRRAAMTGLWAMTD